MPTQQETVRTMAPMTCHPTLCSMRAEVQDGRRLDVTGDEAHPRGLAGFAGPAIIPDGQSADILLGA